MNLQNKRTVWLIAVIAVVVASLPFLIGFVMAPSGYTLLGTSKISPGDAPVYYSYIEQGRQGHVMMADVFTSEHYTPTIWEPLWFIVGQVANVFHLSTPWAYALARSASIPLLVFALWWLARWLWPDWRHQLTALWLTIFGGGIGGIVALVAPHFLDRFGYVAIDQWISEAFVGLTMMASVHFILTVTGTIFVLGLVEKSYEQRSWRVIGWASCLALATLSIHPFLILTWVLLWLGMTFGQWLMNGKVPWQYVVRWVTVGVASLPVLFFYAWQLQHDPLSIARAAQNINTTPSYIRVLFGLGLTLPLGLWGWWRHGQDRRWNFFGVWAIATLVAMYLPLSFSRRLSEGLFIPWAFLSVGSLIALWDFLKQKSMTIRLVSMTIGALLLLNSWPSVIMMFPKAYADEIAGRPGHVYFLSPDFQALVKYLHTTPSELPLLGSLHDSNILAGLSAHHVYYGHPVETVDYQKKSAQVDAFFSSMTNSQRNDFLTSEKICYVVDGPQERAIGQNWDPAHVKFLSIAWQSRTITLYQTATCK